MSDTIKSLFYQVEQLASQKGSVLRVSSKEPIVLCFGGVASFKKYVSGGFGPIEAAPESLR